MVFCCKITIGNLVFNSITSVQITSSWRNFTDTCFIQIPKAVHFRENGRLKPIKSIREYIKTGDKVKVELGYNRELVTEFEGYVSRSPQPTIPVVIECEDEMWQLKRKQVSVSIPDATVKQIVEASAPGYTINAIDEAYGDFSALKTTPAKILEELRKTAGIYTFFRDGVLTSGKVYTDENITPVVANYKFGVNIIDTDLKYVDALDTKVKIYGTSVQSNGEVVRAEIGEEGGDIRREAHTEGLSQAQLKKKLERNYNLVKNFGGYEGTLTSFGFPIVRHGQTVRVVDTIYEQRDTMHLVDQVEISASPDGGYRRVLELGKEVL
ncbi:MAG: hypothetical protein ABGW88_13675 [Leeuwenhoekiella sp.]|uniref:hypothetical protein n=1 Tax=Leeuwenhoekiella sp. TaxID=1977054 RepID=UPI00324240EA